MMGGKILRMKRFRRSPSGRMVILPLDHGVSLGPIAGLEYPEKTMRMGVREGADALVLHKGMLKFLAELDGRLPGIFMHLSAASQLGPAPHHKVLIGSVEEALRYGADGVSLHINLGTPDELNMLQNLGIIGEACSAWQVPLLVMIYAHNGDGAASSDAAIAHAARVAAELGADLIKIAMPEDFSVLKQITASLPVPVVVAGGSRIAVTSVLLERVERALEAGAGGVAIGRNIFQSRQPERVLWAICGMVQRGLSAGRSWDEANKGGGPGRRHPAGNHDCQGEG